MSSFLSSASKTNIDFVLDRLHDTYKTEIFVYVEKTASRANDPTYNSLYKQTSISRQSSHEKVLEKHSIFARVKYIENQSEEALSANVPNSKGRIRVKVDSAGSELIKIASRIEVDGSFFNVDSDPSVVGMFSNNYFIYFLKRES